MFSRLAQVWFEVQARFPQNCITQSHYINTSNDSPEFKNWKGTTQPSDVTELGSFWILFRLSCFPFSHRHYGIDSMLKQGCACKVFQKLKVKMQENEILVE